MCEREEVEKNIVMFPLMAQGHMIPFVALAHQILKTNNDYTITFITTKLNVHTITSSFSTNNIRVLEIPFCSSHHEGLPPGVENTESVPYSLVPDFLHALTRSLQPPFSSLFASLSPPPLCLIADVFLPWSAGVAARHGVFSAVFCGGGAFGFACYRSLWLNLPLRACSSERFALPGFPEASAVHVTQISDLLRQSDGTDKVSEFNRTALLDWSKADAVLFNTVEDLDRTGLNYFRRETGKPIWAVGPVNVSKSEAASVSESESLIRWLNTKPPESVVYVSFGSQNTVSSPQMGQLALALESTCANFIWVVRDPIGLPEGFEERVRGTDRGYLVHKWAPQAEILSHEAVCAFVSHCGWNSVMESLIHGVPIIGWPLAAEQFYNSKLLEEEVGVCLEVGRGRNVVVGHEDLAAKIGLVVNNQTEKGRAMRMKALEVKEMIEKALKADEDGLKGSSVAAMDDFLNAAALHSLKSCWD